MAGDVLAPKDVHDDVGEGIGAVGPVREGPEVVGDLGLVNREVGAAWGGIRAECRGSGPGLVSAGAAP